MTALTFDHHPKPISGRKSLLNRIGRRLSAHMANFSVAMAWANGRRANPADLAEAGYTKDFEDLVIASMHSRYPE